MKGAAGIFRFLIGASGRSERSTLVTLVGVEGSSSRATGTHMAVCENGAYLGSLSGGCIEAAVVAEAGRILSSGQAELVRFGAGSRYIDIRLPCGGGIDLLFTPVPPAALMQAAVTRLESRSAVTLALGLNGEMSIAEDGPTQWRGDQFLARHDPDLRLVIVGHGRETEALVSLSQAFGAIVHVLSPDGDLVDRVRHSGAAADLLRTSSRTDHMKGDDRTAIVFLFHDHDWETELLAQAVELDAFFIGAMGSPATHRARREALLAAGAAPSSIERIVGPIGLIPASRDAETLALSALSQIVAADHERTVEARQSASADDPASPANRDPAQNL